METLPANSTYPGRLRLARRTAPRQVSAGGIARSFGLVLMLALPGCSLDNLVKSNELPPNVTDPAITETPAGALAAYYGTLAQFRTAFGAEGQGSVITATGLLSDELRSTAGGGGSPEDRRTLLETNQRYDQSGTAYALLQKVRGQASQTLGLLTRYQPDEPALAGRVYALEGYAEVLLAELFCSGIPLSTLDYGGDYTYQPGSSTADVFNHAIALFDTALALSGDSTRTQNLARVGQARAWLNLGDVARAAAVVAPVPDAYRDTLTYPATTDTAGNTPNFARISGSGAGSWSYGMGDREGGNGLDYIASGDPRSRGTALATITGFGAQWHPDKYATDGTSALVLASGIEARLIEAEAALLAGDTATWHTTLNALRTDGTFETPDPTGPPGNTDTLWHAGTGEVSGLDTLPDPGTDSARVALTFRERAFWLFLTGHRQGDLRRLLRQYSQYWPSQDRIYPIGQYLGVGFVSQYGSDVTAPIPPAERTLNPLFTGCLSRGP